MAVALSLLIVLPALAQSYDNTTSEQKSGGLTVQVLQGDGAEVANSYFGGTLYVSNDSEAHNRVRIEAKVPDSASVNTRPGADGKSATVADNFDCGVKATVRNERLGRSYSIYLDHDDDNDGTANDGGMQAAVFEVIDSGKEGMVGECASETKGDATADPPVDQGEDDVPAVVGQVPARHGDTLRITVDGVLRGVVTLTVDAEGPEFSQVLPEDGEYVDSQTTKVRFVVTDEDSGLAHDGELQQSPDGDPQYSNMDDDQYTANEPYAMANGRARDIDVMFDEDQSAQGTHSWRPRGNVLGVSYALDMTISGLKVGPNKWHLSAKDRAGNMARTDADPDKDDDQDYTITVDTSSAEFMQARTGISYDADEKEEVVDHSYIALSFKDANGSDVLASVDETKFLVEGSEIVGFIHPSDKSDCDDDDKKVIGIGNVDMAGCIREPRSYVYLQLAEALAPDATPTVQMFGGAATDLAGNPSSRDETEAEDKIAPSVTATLTTAVVDRPIIRPNGEVTLRISSDEELRRAPSVYFAMITDNESTKDKQQLKIGTPTPGDRVRVVAGEDNTWEQTYTYSDINSGEGLYAVIVTAQDVNDNVGGSSGWTAKEFGDNPMSGDSVKLSALEEAVLVVELDKTIADPKFTLSPETDTDSDKTESANPFITIAFDDEKDEYGMYASGGELKGKYFGDSHSAVTLTSVTLNGNDVSDGLSSISNRESTLSLSDLAVDSYELKVTGQDDAGNTVAKSYKFDVTARKPYELGLTPGWNLVSLPGTPLDSSVGAVMGNSMEASIILAYQNDEWLTAVNDNGTWRGTLTDIMGGYGYWVQTTAFESIKTLIPETDTSSTLPTARVIAGWNLLGVVDVQQGKADKVPSGGGDADDYFGNISWKVAYSFDTRTNQWSKSIPTSKPTEANSDAIKTGKGYWVWSSSAGTLVP